MQSQSGVSAFPTSQWSLIARAGTGDANSARLALAELCRRYWYPIYAFLRRQGASKHDAEDITQGLFAHVLDHEVIAAANPARGRFRTYLLTCCKNYMANQKRAGRAEKRGGQAVIVGMDFEEAAMRYDGEPASHVDAEQLFMRRWAFTLLDETFTAVEADYSSSGRDRLMKRLRPTLSGEIEASKYAVIAVELNMTEEAVRKAAQRLRERFRDELRRRIGDTVESEEEIAEEIRDLFAAVRS